jgi:hypothetical protein
VSFQSKRGTVKKAGKFRPVLGKSNASRIPSDFLLYNQLLANKRLALNPKTRIFLSGKFQILNSGSSEMPQPQQDLFLSGTGAQLEPGGFLAGCLVGTQKQKPTCHALKDYGDF